MSQVHVLQVLCFVMENRSNESISLGVHVPGSVLQVHHSPAGGPGLLCDLQGDIQHTAPCGPDRGGDT